MKLYLLRHAEAVERGTPGHSRDSERPLTPKGIEEMRRVARGMKRLKLSFDIILTSPYVRARHTAEIAAQALGACKQWKLSNNLVAEADPADLIAEIRREYSECQDFLLVGHEPYLSHLVSKLLTNTFNLDLNFKKAGLLRLSVEALCYGRCASLDWFLAPRQLSKLAKS